MRRIAGIGLLVCVVVAAGIGVWWVLRAAPGFITGLYPADGQRAVFTMRHNPYDGPSRAWIGLVDVHAGVRWSRELPALTYSSYARHGITVHGGQVTVKVLDVESHAQILAFDLASGKRRWASAPIVFKPSEYPLQPYVVSGERPFDDGRLLFHCDHDRVTARLVARSSADGSIRWSHELDAAGMRSLLFAPETIAYRHEASWTFLGRSDGKVVRTLEAYGDGCILDGRFVTWDHDQLLTVDLAHPGLPPRTQPLPSRGIAARCGVHGDELVFTVSIPAPSGAPDRTKLIGVRLDPPGIDWKLDLGTSSPADSAHQRDNRGPDADPLRGTLSDFVPVLLEQREGDTFRLAVIDLIRHRIAWQSRPRPELANMQVFRGSGDQHFCSMGARLVAISGKTGEITAAVEINHECPRAFYAIDQRLWVYSMKYARMDSLPWAVLDGRTLALIGHGNDDYTPRAITEDFRAWLSPASGDVL